MNLRAWFIALVLAGVVLFASLNWVAFTDPTLLSFGFTHLTLPLGLLMLGVTVLVSALFLVYIVYQQAGAILESRRYAKELKALREVADKAEASRFAELRAFLEAELRRIEAQSAAASREVGGRIEQLESRLQAQTAESTRSLSAYVGEIEDKLDRLLPLALPGVVHPIER
jgi:hypothetical protein